MSTKETLPVLDPKTISIAASVKEAVAAGVTLKKNANGGQDAYLKGDEKLFKSLLPETTTTASGKELTRDETYDVLLQSQDHRTFVVAGVAEALSETARELRGKHDDLDTVFIEANMGGRDKYKAHWTHKVEENAEIPKKGEVAAKRTVYGSITGKFQVHGTKPGAGELNKVFDRSKQLSQDLFGK